MHADVPETGGTEKCVTQRVSDDVAVRVAGPFPVEGHAHAADN